MKQKPFCTNYLRVFLVVLFTSLVVSSCGIVTYIWDGENAYRRRQGNLLCENYMVHEFRAVLTNRDAILGKEIIKCPGIGKTVPYGLKLSEEQRFKEKAEDIFFAICGSSLTRNAKLVIKGRKLGIIRRDCFK